MMMTSNELGVVSTIYEEECECSSTSPSLSPSLSSSPTPLHSKVQSWSLATGRETDVTIYVQGVCFHVHKDPLTARSTYLRCQLSELNEITLPLNLTAETFALIADFCYGCHVTITPFNVVALRTAAELLEMTESNGKRNENLKQITETYFRRVVSVNCELAMIAFKSCLTLLPEAETTSFLLSRSVEALSLSNGCEELEDCVGDIIKLEGEEFDIVADVLQCTLTSHDLLYRIIDLYIKEKRSKMTEEQKNDTCSFIDCDKLSPQILVHAVQNPILPLRFIVRAMLIEQLNTRRAILATANHHYSLRNEPVDHDFTLGSILRREAAARESVHLKAEMESTNLRIKSLENKLAGMRKLLEKSEKEKGEMEKKLKEKARKQRDSNAPNQVASSYKQRDDSSNDRIWVGEAEKDGKSVMESSRSASFHFGTIKDARIERGERGSTSFASSRFSSGTDKSPGTNKVSGKGLLSRLRSRLWASKTSAKRSDGGGPSKKNGSGDVEDDDMLTRKIHLLTNGISF